MFTDMYRIKTFITAGNSTITLKSKLTQKYYTYRVRKMEDKVGVYFVSLLTGTDNNSSYNYIGLFYSFSNTFKTTAKSKMNYNSTPVKAFMYLCNNFANKDLPKNLTVYHENKCGRCNRKLTTPESIQSGYGPECIKFICE
ncbi:MAG: hypothetical protein [Caudoviricetes sp.]|nr:MAG: hypothetical protein [Caudoviricetes sp.]